MKIQESISEILLVLYLIDSNTWNDLSLWYYNEGMVNCTPILA